MARVAKDQRRLVGEVHSHHRLADGQVIDPGGHLGDDDWTRFGTVDRRFFAVDGLILMLGFALAR